MNKSNKNNVFKTKRIKSRGFKKNKKKYIGNKYKTKKNQKVINLKKKRKKSFRKRLVSLKKKKQQSGGTKELVLSVAPKTTVEPKPFIFKLDIFSAQNNINNIELMQTYLQRNRSISITEDYEYSFYLPYDSKIVLKKDNTEIPALSIQTEGTNGTPKGGLKIKEKPTTGFTVGDFKNSLEGSGSILRNIKLTEINGNISETDSNKFITTSLKITATAKDGAVTIEITISGTKELDTFINRNIKYLIKYVIYDRSNRKTDSISIERIPQLE